MKKLFMSMCLIMMVSLVACSDSDSKENNQEGQVSIEKAQEESTVEIIEKEFELGQIENLVYENKFIGIGYAIESNWRFYNEEEIMELNNYTMDVAGEEYKEIVQEAALIYDMYAISDNQLDNININLEKMDNSIIDNLVVEDSLKNTIPILLDTYNNIGYSNVQGELDKISIENEKFTCLKLTGEINGLQMYQKIIPIKCNGYLANITITTYEEDTVDLLAQQFYFVK